MSPSSVVPALLPPPLRGVVTLAPGGGRVDVGSAGDLFNSCSIQDCRLSGHIEAEPLGLPRPDVGEGIWAPGSSCSDTCEPAGLAGAAASKSARSPMAANFAASVLLHGLSPAWSEVSMVELNDANKPVGLVSRC
jgi:hypothetical protein